LLFIFSIKVNSLCTLPQIWSGKWYMSKETDLMTIDKTTFVNKGVCIENVEDKFLFYESDECYRCIFVMQKHQNVLQYRASKHINFPIFSFISIMIYYIFIKFNKKVTARNKVTSIQTVKIFRPSPN
jgi:hypothetical protein